jgi:hypothetical protein
MDAPSWLLLAARRIKSSAGPREDKREDDYAGVRILFFLRAVAHRLCGMILARSGLKAHG